MPLCLSAEDSTMQSKLFHEFLRLCLQRLEINVDIFACMWVDLYNSIISNPHLDISTFFLSMYYVKKTTMETNSGVIQRHQTVFKRIYLCKSIAQLCKRKVPKLKCPLPGTKTMQIIHFIGDIYEKHVQTSTFITLNLAISKIFIFPARQKHVLGQLFIFFRVEILGSFLL